MYDSDKAVEFALESPYSYEWFDSLEAAEVAAGQRSNEIGRLREAFAEEKVTR
jgi:hypothetical protein